MGSPRIQMGYSHTLVPGPEGEPTGVTQPRTWKLCMWAGVQAELKHISFTGVRRWWPPQKSCQAGRSSSTPPPAHRHVAWLPGSLEEVQGAGGAVRPPGVCGSIDTCVVSCSACRRSLAWYCHHSIEVVSKSRRPSPCLWPVKLPPCTFVFQAAGTDSTTVRRNPV